MTKTTRVCFDILVLVACGFAVSPAIAQPYPNRPITYIYPYQAGSALEAGMRVVNAEAGKLLGQPILLENRPGANVRLGINAFRQSPADAHLLSLAPDTLLVHQPLTDPAFTLELDKDYAAVRFLARNFLVLAAHPSLPFRDVKGFVAYAKANPGKINWAYTPGSITQFLPDMFKGLTGIETTMIPFKGGGDQIIPHVTGQVDIGVASLSGVKQFIDSGKLIALATTGEQRVSMFPNVPTLQEAGVPMAQSTWFGLIAPPGVAKENIATIYRAYTAAFQMPEVNRRLQELAFTPDLTMTTAEFSVFVRSEIKTWTPILKKVATRPQ